MRWLLWPLTRNYRADPIQLYGVSTKWGIFNEVFCPKEETFAFLEGVLDEVMALFPSPYIHIGATNVPKPNGRTAPIARH